MMNDDRQISDLQESTDRSSIVVQYRVRMLEKRVQAIDDKLDKNTGITTATLVSVVLGLITFLLQKVHF